MGPFGPRRCRSPLAADTASSQLIAVLDTGGVEGLAPITEQRRARLRALRDHATDIVVASAVLAEGVLTGSAGHDYHVRRLLGLVSVVDVDEELAYAAGSLRRDAIRAGFDPPPSGVDAIVAALADQLAADDDVQIVTSDSDDFELLASLATNAARISILVV